MPSVCTIGKRGSGIVVLLLFTLTTAFSQDNSPWSRYGLGDVMPSVNIVNRGLGHTAAAYADFQTINFVNPASYSKFGTQRAIFDIGLDINSRTLRNNRGSSYTSSNATIPYLAGGFQLRGEKSKTDWGLAFGLRPLTKVSYNVESGTRLRSGDSVATNFEGNGGTYQAFIGTAIGIKNFSIGGNGGYRFGSKDYTTRVFVLNDTVPDRYAPGRLEVRNNFGGAFAELGMQYLIKLGKQSSLQLGAYGSLQAPMNATRTENFESFTFVGEAGVERTVDSVTSLKNIRGGIQYPAYYGAGFLYDVQGKGRLSIAADYVIHEWGNYRYYGAADLLRHSRQIKIGAQFLPDALGETKGFWTNVLYRGGLVLTREPFTVDGEMNSYGVTLGAGIAIKRYSYAEVNRSNILNFAMEFGQRSNRNSLLRENYFRLAMSFSFSDIWFIKRRYD